MLVFIVGGLGSGWVPLALFFALPLFNGALALIAQLVLQLFGSTPLDQDAREARAAAPPTSSRFRPGQDRPRAQQQDDDLWEGSLAFDVARGIMFTVAGFAFYRAVMLARTGGGSWPEVLRRMLTGRGGRPRSAPAPPRRLRVTVEQVAETLQKLPTETHVTESQLEAMSVHDLKERLQARGVDCSKCLEKQELLDKFKCGGSSASTCSICCDDFEADDPVRVLRCQHRFHLECVDKWLLSSTDFSRPPACPLCNAELIKQPPSGRTVAQR